MTRDEFVERHLLRVAPSIVASVAEGMDHWQKCYDGSVEAVATLNRHKRNEWWSATHKEIETAQNIWDVYISEALNND